MRRRLFQLLVAAVAVVVAVGVVEVVVRISDGDFDGDYALQAQFSQAGYGLQPGSEVVWRGVQVGRVTTITLHGGQALVGLAIDPSFHLAADTTATLEPINLFGADQIALSEHGSGSTSRAVLKPGDTIRRTAVAPGLENLFAAAVPLLDKIDTGDLSSVVANLAQASASQGPVLRDAIDEGAHLAAFLDQTLPAQITALDSLTGFVTALAPTAGSLDAIGTSANQLLPVFNANSAAYKKLLATLTPFANNLTELLSAYHPDIETLLASGDDVARLVLANRQDIGTLVAGLAMYEEKIGAAVNPADVLPNGTNFVDFDVFVSLGNLDQLVCSLLDPQLPGQSYLAPLQQALTGAGTPLQCPTSAGSSSTTTADGAGSTPSAVTPAGAVTSPSPTVSSGSSSIARAAKGLSTDLYGVLGEPSGGGSSTTSSGASGSSGQGGGPGSTGNGSSGSSTGSGNALQQILGGLL